MSVKIYILAENSLFNLVTRDKTKSSRTKPSAALEKIILFTAIQNFIFLLILEFIVGFRGFMSTLQ